MTIMENQRGISIRKLKVFIHQESIFPLTIRNI